MAQPKLVKINEVHLYVGLTDGAADCVEALRLLRKAGIKFTLLNYSDQEDHHQHNFKALSGWPFGSPDNPYKKEFSDYPIVTWKECYSDWTVQQHAAHGLQELKESNLLSNEEVAESAKP